MNTREMAAASRQKTHLRAWREHRKLGLVQAADLVTATKRLTMSASHLSRLERGHYPYSQDAIEALAQVYRCRPADLIGRDPVIVHDPMLTLYADLEPTDRLQVWDFLRGLLKPRSAS